MYDGKRPKSLELFLKILNISEDEFYDIVSRHVIEPHKIMQEINLKNHRLI